MTAARKPLLVRVIAVLAVAAIVVTVLIRLMPRAFDADVAKIGKGRPAVVLVYDPSFLISSEMSESLNAVRGDFEPALLFLIADQNVPQGRRLAAAHAAELGTLLLFDATGKRLAAYTGGPNPEAVRRFLETHYASAAAARAR